MLLPAGAKYSLYCANVARTYLVDPSKRQQEEYAALLAALEAAVKALVPGAPCSAAHAAAVAALEVSDGVCPMALCPSALCPSALCRAVGLRREYALSSVVRTERLLPSDGTQMHVLSLCQCHSHAQIFGI